MVIYQQVEIGVSISNSGATVDLVQEEAPEVDYQGHTLAPLP